MLSLLRLHEYGHHEISLSAAEAAAIRNGLARQVTLLPGRRPGHYHLRAGAHVGFAVLPGGRVLSIEPRLRIDTLFALLAAVYDPEHTVFRDEVQGYTTLRGLFEFVVRIWVAEVEALIARGVRRGYRAEAGPQAAVRGRLLVAESVGRRPGRHDQPWCEYRLFGADLPENRILRWTAHVLAGYLYREPTLAARLARSARVIAGAGAALDPAAARLFPHMALDRLNQAYRPALALAQLLLDHLTFSGSAGSEPFLAYLVDMSWLFERYAGTILARAAAGWGAVLREQERHPLDAARRFVVRPDMLLYRGGRAALVLDAKYKLAADEGDIYQMLAYCHMLGLTEAVLVHPAHETAPAGAVHVRGTPPVRVHYLALGLEGGPAQLAAQAVGWVERVGSVLAG